MQLTDDAFYFLEAGLGPVDAASDITGYVIEANAQCNDEIQQQKKHEIFGGPVQHSGHRIAQV